MIHHFGFVLKRKVLAVVQRFYFLQLLLDLKISVFKICKMSSFSLLIFSGLARVFWTLGQNIVISTHPVTVINIVQSIEHFLSS